MIKAASLFSGAGIGEFYLKAIGIDVLIANEIVKSRANTHALLYPDCLMINADITEKQTQHKIIKECKKKHINMIIATPPCQGLSSAGSNRTEESLYDDPRNFLILSAINIVDEIMPDYFIVENVSRFQQMLFPYNGKLVGLQDLLEYKYSSIYNISCDILNAADYGVPQTRLRIVYRMWKKNLQWKLPQKETPITLQDAIGDLPPLEAGESSSIKNHFARKHPRNQIECMMHTPTGQSAFKNDVYYPKKTDGSRIKGYGNTYKRMRWDSPAPTITMRNEIISSQENVHPGRKINDDTWSDARVLTLRELLIVSSLPADLNQPSNISETAFRQLIGEGIPPLMMKKIMKGIDGIDE